MQKMVLMTQITMMVLSLTTYSPHMDILKCEVKWALEAFLQKKPNQTKTKKLVEVTEFQLSYFKS